MHFAQVTPTRDSTSELLDAPRHREVAVLGHSTAPWGKPERHTKEMEHRSGIFFSRGDRGENRGSHGAAEGAPQQQQHFTSPFSSVSP